MNAQPVAQKTIPEITKVSIDTEKKKDIKTPPSEIMQQLPRNIVLPPGSLLPPIVVSPNVRLPPKPPNADTVTTSPNLGLDPNMDIEEIHPNKKEL